MSERCVVIPTITCQAPGLKDKSTALDFAVSTWGSSDLAVVHLSPRPLTRTEGEGAHGQPRERRTSATAQAKWSVGALFAGCLGAWTEWGGAEESV